MAVRVSTNTNSQISQKAEVDIDALKEKAKAEKEKARLEKEKQEELLKIQKEQAERDYIKSIFGEGFTDKEYAELGLRFRTMQNNYPLRTAMHIEALSTYIKYAFKRDKAIAEDDIESADKWGKLAAKQATDAKINPSQLSAADLSEGMTSFSQLSSMVEKAEDIIPLLPKFIAKPHDRVDYTIWQYVNYIRDLEGKSLIKYADLYKFLLARYKENKDKLDFDFFDGNGNFDTNDIGGD